MLQSTRKRRNSRNYADYEWAEREKKRLEQKAQELMERTRASQVSKKVVTPAFHYPGRKLLARSRKTMKRKSVKKLKNWYGFFK